MLREEICGDFLLSGMEWKCITQIHGYSLVFSKDWTNLFTSKIEENFVCVLSFKYKKFNKLNSRKQNSCFYRAKAVCKFQNCFEFTFVIKKDPSECKIDENIIVEQGWPTFSTLRATFGYLKNPCFIPRITIVSILLKRD